MLLTKYFSLYKYMNKRPSSEQWLSLISVHYLLLANLNSSSLNLIYPKKKKKKIKFCLWDLLLSTYKERKKERLKLVACGFVSFWFEKNGKCCGDDRSKWVVGFIIFMDSAEEYEEEENDDGQSQGHLLCFLFIFIVFCYGSVQDSQDSAWCLWIWGQESL